MFAPRAEISSSRVWPQSGVNYRRIISVRSVIKVQKIRWNIAMIKRAN